MKTSKALVSCALLAAFAAGCQKNTMMHDKGVATEPVATEPMIMETVADPTPAYVIESDGGANAIQYTTIDSTEAVFIPAESQPVETTVLGADLGAVEAAPMSTESIMIDSASDVMASPEPAYVIESPSFGDTPSLSVEPEPIMMEMKTPGSGEMMQAASELMTESELSILDAPTLDNDVVPVLDNAMAPAPAMIESELLPAVTNQAVSTYAQPL